MFSALPKLVMDQKFQQLDIPFSNAHFFVLPKHLPGRVNVDDFVFFNIPAGVNPNDYMVAITTLDTSGPSSIRTIGSLAQKDVELPHVMLSAYAVIYVMPKNNPNLPTFYSRLNRGSTYDIPVVNMRMHKQGTRYEMRRHGMLTAGVDESKLAY